MNTLLTFQMTLIQAGIIKWQIIIMNFKSMHLQTHKTFIRKD